LGIGDGPGSLRVVRRTACGVPKYSEVAVEGMVFLHDDDYVIHPAQDAVCEGGLGNGQVSVSRYNLLHVHLSDKKKGGGGDAGRCERDVCAADGKGRRCTPDDPGDGLPNYGLPYYTSCYTPPRSYSLGRVYTPEFLLPLTLSLPSFRVWHESCLYYAGGAASATA
jgi:hypothetical protein